MTDLPGRRVFVDTNVLFYAIDRDAGAKGERARAILARLWDERAGVLGTQVLAEWAVNLRRKAGLTWNEIAEVVRPWLAWDVIAPAGEDVLAALRLATDHQLSFWDAMVVRAAVRAGADVLLTEDMNPGQVVEGVRLVDPFRDLSPR